MFSVFNFDGTKNFTARTFAVVKLAQVRVRVSAAQHLLNFSD